MWFLTTCGYKRPNEALSVRTVSRNFSTALCRLHPTGAMNAVTVVIFALGLFCVTAAAETTVEEERSLQVALDMRSEGVAEEAVLLGHILRNAAREIQLHAELENEVDEYFFRKLWNKTKTAVKNAGRKIKMAVQKAKPHLKNGLKETGMQIAKAVFPVIKQKLQEKAIALATKLFVKSFAGYALQDSDNHVDVLSNLCALMDQEGKRLIERGEKLGAQRFAFHTD